MELDLVGPLARPHILESLAALIGAMLAELVSPNCKQHHAWFALLCGITVILKHVV